MIVHTLFDLAAAASAMAVTFLVYRWRLSEAGRTVETLGIPYAVVLVLGAVAGGYGAGTLNLWLSGDAGVGRSILGALAGAVAAVEIFKRVRGLRASTGLIFVPAFATSVAMGRWGCFLSGLEDRTHGTPTSLPWGHDFGDGIARHPVQLYESFAMLLFLAASLLALRRRSPFFMASGFYILVFFYAGQRFLWEFLKPYAPLLGPLNLFHLLCLGLMIYSVVMIRGRGTCQ